MMSIPVTVNGVEYKSVRQACIALGKNAGTVHRRLSENFTVDDAFNFPNTDAVLSRDHLGKLYPSFKKMCEAYKKHPTTVRYRLNQGLSIEKALTTPADLRFANKR